jgi:Phage integrase family
VMRETGERPNGVRLRALVVVLWRAGLRISEALALAETNLEHCRGSLLVRHGKGDKRREVGMDEWAWDQLRPWQDVRRELPVGPLFCVISGATCGRHWAPAAARHELRAAAARAGVRRRFAPHRSRTSTRGRRPERDSASARSRKSWGDFGLSPRHRQRGGDRSRALAATADDSGSSRAAPLALPRERSSAHVVAEDTRVSSVAGVDSWRTPRRSSPREARSLRAAAGHDGISAVCRGEGRVSTDSWRCGGGYPRPWRSSAVIPLSVVQGTSGPRMGVDQ